MYIKKIDDLIHVLALQEANLPTYQAAVGATAADIAAVSEDLASLRYISKYAAIIETSKKAIFSIKAVIFDGEETDSISEFPVLPVASPPTPPIAGCRTRALRRNRRFKAAPGFQPEIAAALGLTGNPNGPQNLATFQPIISVKAAESGNSFTINVTNRTGSDMWEVLVSPRDSTEWHVIKAATGRTAEIVYPNKSTEPVQLQVRVQLLRKNERHGRSSHIATVTVNP